MKMEWLATHTKSVKNTLLQVIIKSVNSERGINQKKKKKCKKKKACETNEVKISV